MDNKIVLRIFCCLVVLSNVGGFKILQIAPVPSKSHYFLSSALANGLGEAGHNVTLVTTFAAEKSDDDKFNLIVLKDFLKTLKYGEYQAL